MGYDSERAAVPHAWPPPAGAGKTRTMGVLAQVLAQHGIKPRALAVAQKATD